MTPTPTPEELTAPEMQQVRLLTITTHTRAEIREGTHKEEAISREDTIKVDIIKEDTIREEDTVREDTKADRPTTKVVGNTTNTARVITGTSRAIPIVTALIAAHVVLPALPAYFAAAVYDGSPSLLI
jgi:hypothetical protein